MIDYLVVLSTGIIAIICITVWFQIIDGQKVPKPTLIMSMIATVVLIVDSIVTTLYK